MKSFAAADYERALESWTWLDFTDKTPRFASLFGDVFLESPDGWWFLDTVGGLLTSVGTGPELQKILNRPEGQDEYLMLGLAQACQDAGIKLGESEVYSFTPPPVVGGPMVVANVMPLAFVLAVNLAGQVHAQVRDLPPGTPITGFTIA